MDSATSKQVGSRQDGLSYRIKKGDSLASIAVSNWELLQSLDVIPKTATKTRPNIEAAAYTLARMNNIPRAELVEPGQIVYFARPSPQIASPAILPNGLPKEVIKPTVPQNQQQQSLNTAHYEIPQGGNLSQAARAKWTELQNLGTIPKAWNRANPNHVHLAALRLAKINNIENPNRITSRKLNLAATYDTVRDDNRHDNNRHDDNRRVDKVQSGGQPTPDKLPSKKEPDKKANTPVADTPVATEKFQPNPPLPQSPVPATPTHSQPTPPPTPLSDEDALPPQATQPAIDIDEGTQNEPQHSILFPDQKPDPTAIAKVSEPSIGSYLRPTALRTNEHGFVSVLVLGKDFDGRPDIIKQVLVDPNSLKTAIIDIPRDLRINRPGNRKLNSLSTKKGGAGDKQIVAAVEEITGQSSTYVTSVSLNDIESLKSTFTSLFPEGVTLPTDKRYFHTMSGNIFEPKERITDLSRLEDYMRMRYAYVVSPTWKPEDGLAGQEKLIASDLERQKRQSELMASIKSQLGYTDAGRTLLNIPLEKFFKPENNPDIPSKIALATFFGQVATLGEEPGRFQPKLLYKYNASGQPVERATAKNPYTSISVDIDGLRTDLVKYFSP